MTGNCALPNQATDSNVKVSFTTVLPTEILDRICALTISHTMGLTELHKSFEILSMIDKTMYAVGAAYRSPHPSYRSFQSYCTVTDNLSEHDHDILLAHPPFESSHLANVVTKLKDLESKRSNGLKITLGRTFLDALSHKSDYFWGNYSAIDPEARTKLVQQLITHTVSLLNDCQITQISYIQPSISHHGFNSLKKAMELSNSGTAAELNPAIQYVIHTDEDSSSTAAPLSASSHTAVVFNSNEDDHGGRFLQTLLDTNLPVESVTQRWTFVNLSGNEVDACMKRQTSSTWKGRGEAGERRSTSIGSSTKIPTWNDRYKKRLCAMESRGLITTAQLQSVRVVDVSEAGEFACYSGIGQRNDCK